MTQWPETDEGMSVTDRVLMYLSQGENLTMRDLCDLCGEPADVVWSAMLELELHQQVYAQWMWQAVGGR